MKINDLRKKSVVELKEMLISLKKELMNLRFQKVTGGLEKSAAIGATRKKIAQVYTLLVEKETEEKRNAA